MSQKKSVKEKFVLKIRKNKSKEINFIVDLRNVFQPPKNFLLNFITQFYHAIKSAAASRPSREHCTRKGQSHERSRRATMTL